MGDVKVKPVSMDSTQGEAGREEAGFGEIDNDDSTVDVDHEIGGVHVGEAVKHGLVGEVATLEC